MTTDAASNPRPTPQPETVRYISTELNLSSGELVYGFGEQFGSFVKNGQFGSHPQITVIEQFT